MANLSFVTQNGDDFFLESVSTKLLSGLYTQRRTGKFCDVKILVGGTCLWTHTCVLSTFSAKLHNLFVTRRNTQKKSPKSKPKLYANWSLNNPLEITLSDLRCSQDLELSDCLECVDKVIDFLYHGKINIDGNHIDHVENLGKLLNISELSGICQQARITITSKKHDESENCPDGVVHVNEEQQEMSVDRIECAEETLQNTGDEQQRSKNRKQNSGRSYSCLGCGTTHRNAAALLKHLRDPTSSNLHGLVCSLCLKYTAPDAATLLAHLQLHDHALPFFCFACEARFRTRTALSSHEPRHSTETPFLCGECGRGFKWKHALRSHALVHSAEKRHLCDTCGFSTAHVSTFRTHRMVHAGACFRCPQPNCTFVASRKQTLDHHVATHSKERHYQCEVCGQSFSMYKNLRRHAARHEPSPAGLVCCPVPGCLYANTRLDKIKAHAERHRSGKPVRSLLMPRVRRTSATTATASTHENVISHPDEGGDEKIVIDMNEALIPEPVVTTPQLGAEDIFIILPADGSVFAIT